MFYRHRSFIHSILRNILPFARKLRPPTAYQNDSGLSIQTFSLLSGSGKITVYESTLLPKSATGVICGKRGPEAELATAGTW